MTSRFVIASVLLGIPSITTGPPTVLGATEHHTRAWSHRHCWLHYSRSQFFIGTPRAAFDAPDAGRTRNRSSAFVAA